MPTLQRLDRAVERVDTERADHGLAAWPVVERRGAERAEEFAEKIHFLIGRPRRDDAADRVGSACLRGLAEAAGDQIERLVPRRGDEFDATPDQRAGQALTAVDVVVGETAPVAEPALVDGRVRGAVRRSTSLLRYSTFRLQPTLHLSQTLGTLVRSQGRARKRKGIEVSAPTGQSSIVLPE